MHISRDQKKVKPREVLTMDDSIVVNAALNRRHC